MNERTLSHAYHWCVRLMHCPFILQSYILCIYCSLRNTEVLYMTTLNRGHPYYNTLISVTMIGV